MNEARPLDVGRLFVVQMRTGEGIQLPGRVPAIQIRNKDKTFFHLFPVTAALKKKMAGRSECYWFARLAAGILVFTDETTEEWFHMTKKTREDYEGLACENQEFESLFRPSKKKAAR